MNLALDRLIEELNDEMSGCSVLERLYELWINQDPVYDAQVQQLYEKLGEWMENMEVSEADRMTGVIVQLCTAYSRKGFLDGAKLAGHLMREILQK